jgi:hypothetical protein
LDRTVASETEAPIEWTPGPLALQRIEAPTIITIITTTWSIIINVRDDGAKRVRRLCEAAVRPGPLGADLGAEQRAVEQPRGRRRLRAPGRLLGLVFLLCCLYPAWT